MIAHSGSLRVVSCLFVASAAAIGFACGDTSAGPDGADGSTNGADAAVRESHGSEQANGACRQEPQTLRGTRGAGESCETFADCAPVCCACDVQGPSVGFNAAACVDGRCAAKASACPLAKSSDYCPLDPVSSPDGGTKVDGGGGADGGVVPTDSSLCVPYTASHAGHRASERLAQTSALIAQMSSPSGSGSVNISRDGGGRPTYISFSGTPSYNVSLSYDSSGHLTYMRRSWSGSTPTDTHSYSYDSDGRLTYYRLSWSDSTPTQTESYSYDSDGSLTFYRLSWSNSNPTVSETFSYDSDAYITFFRRSWSNSNPTESETFSYDSDHRLTFWRRTWSDSTPTESLSATYSGSSRLPSGTQTSGPVPGGSKVVDCKK